MGRRLGVMGGTFDPIHYGHLVTAEEALVQFALDGVVFVPTGQPWMKEERQVSPAEDRYLMTVIATASNPKFSVSRVEVDREGPTYTVDTLHALGAEHPDAELYFITGADAMLEILEWKDPEEVLSLAHFIAATRPGYDLTRFESTAPRHPNVSLMNIPALAISSTDVPGAGRRRAPDPLPGPGGRQELHREGGPVPVTRRLAVLLVVAMLAAASIGILLVARGTEPSTVRARSPETAGLSLLVVETASGPLAALVGSTGFGRHGALVIPPEAVVTIPGQGDGTVGEALDLPARQAATAVGNLLGTWVDHHATIRARDLVAPADELGGVELGGELRSSDDLRSMLEEPAPGAAAGLQVVLETLFGAGARWDANDLTDVDEASEVVGTLSSAAGSRVALLQVDELASGVFRASTDQVSQALTDAFGGPTEEAVAVIVLNGNGVPGIGEQVAERILPGGFRIVVSENASTFDHGETLVVVGSPDDVGLGQRVRDLLGVGSVSVSVGSGIAPVTVVVGRDFIG